jgi:ubiquinol-cytochrome c reductase cytochrome b subunit
MSRLARIGDWFEQRLKIGGALRETMEHQVPRKSASWFYVFGSAALTVFMMQIFTGVMLALIYVPSAGEAWNSLQYLNHGVTLGWFLRAVHGWGSNFMVAIVLIHLVQVVMFGAYKFPRELTWIVGIFLLLMTLGMAFTGQVLRFDQDAYWGLGIGASICGRVPFIGAWVVHLLLGGPIIAGDTLSRFFALHVFVIPGLLIAFVSVHLLTSGAPLDVRPGVRGNDAQGRRTVRAGGDLERHDLCLRRDRQRAGVRRVFWPLWTRRPARSDDCANGSQA